MKKKNIIHFNTKKQKVGGLSSVIQCYKDSITSWYMDESDEGRRLLVLPSGHYVQLKHI